MSSDLPTNELPVIKSRKGLWITLAVVLLLIAGGGVALAVFVFGKVAKPVADAAEAEREAKRISIVAPETLGGRPKNVQGEMQTLVDTMKSTFKTTVPNSTAAEAGFYGDPTKKDIVMMFAATSTIVSPEKELDQMFKVGVGGGTAATDVVDVPTGPLGGKAKCGKADASGTPLAMCAWADNGSVGLIVWYFKGVDEVKGEFTTMRGEIEKKS